MGSENRLRSINGSGQLQSLHGDVDYYNGQVGTDTLEIVLNAAQSNLVAVQQDLANYATFLASNPGVKSDLHIPFRCGLGRFDGLGLGETQHRQPGADGGCHGDGAEF